MSDDELVSKIFEMVKGKQTPAPAPTPAPTVAPTLAPVSCVLFVVLMRKIKSWITLALL